MPTAAIIILLSSRKAARLALQLFMLPARATTHALRGLFVWLFNFFPSQERALDREGHLMMA